MAESRSLSVCVITCDEEPNLPRCLASVADLASEVVVVDSGSRDRTREIARAAGARVVEQPFAGYVRQKQVALELATGQWVLALDADEWLDDELRQAIAATLAADLDPAVDGFRLARRPFYLGRWIRAGGWSPEWKLRLVRRERARWSGYDPHDRLEVDGRVRRLPGRLCHFPYRDLADHVDTLNRYTDILASHWPPVSRLRLLLGMTVEPVLVFAHRFVVQGGFRDGVRGLIAAATTSFYFFLRHAKLWARTHGAGTPEENA